MKQQVLALAMMVVLAVPAARPVAAPDEGVSSRDGMVVCTSAPACDAGAAILAKGGSAVDAAVATAFALAVTLPSAGNIEIIGIVGATFSADGKLLAAASHHGFARIWDTATLRPMGDFRGFLQGVSSVAFSPDSRRLVTGSDGREAIKFWDVESHEELLTLEGEGSWFNVTAFSADGAVLGSMNASDSKRSILHLWRAPSWEEIEATEKASQRDNRK